MKGEADSWDHFPAVTAGGWESSWKRGGHLFFLSCSGACWSCEISPVCLRPKTYLTRECSCITKIHFSEVVWVPPETLSEKDYGSHLLLNKDKRESVISIQNCRNQVLSTPAFCVHAYMQIYWVQPGPIILVVITLWIQGNAQIT